MGNKKPKFHRTNGVLPFDTMVSFDGNIVRYRVPKMGTKEDDIVSIFIKEARYLQKNQIFTKLVRNRQVQAGKVYDYGWTPIAYDSECSTWNGYGHLSRFLMGVKDEHTVVDHIDGNHMNCTRDNLRACSRRENSMNRRRTDSRSKSGVTGICPYRRDGRWLWKVYISTSPGVQVQLGIFADWTTAVLTRWAAEKEHYGEFAPTRNGEIPPEPSIDE